jgi:hypothetical protein
MKNQVFITFLVVFAIQIVAVDPEGSILAEPENLNKSDTTFYEVEVFTQRQCYKIIFLKLIKIQHSTKWRYLHRDSVKNFFFFKLIKIQHSTKWRYLHRDSVTKLFF